MKFYLSRILISLLIFGGLLKFQPLFSQQKTSEERSAELKRIKSLLIDSSARQNHGMRLYAFNEDFSTYSYMWFSSGKESTPSFNMERKFIDETIFLPTPLDLNQSELGEELMSAEFPEGGALAFSPAIAANNVRRRLDTIYIFTPRRKVYDGSIAGIRSFFTPFKRLCHIWMIPEGYHYHSYTCNRPGKWKLNGQLLYYTGEDVNNLFFDIKVLPNHLSKGLLSGRTVEYVKTISSKGNSFKLAVFDPDVEDQDVVSIYYNGEKIISSLIVSNKPAVFILPLEKMENRLVLHLEHEGKYSPNTAAIKINEMEVPVVFSPDAENSQGVIIMKKIGK